MVAVAYVPNVTDDRSAVRDSPSLAINGNQRRHGGHEASDQSFFRRTAPVGWAVRGRQGMAAMARAPSDERECQQMDDVDPTGAGSAAEFVLMLRRYRELAGLSYRQLACRARQAGASLPPSTVATMLSRPTLPARNLIATYIRACGGREAEVAAWLAARSRLAAAEPGRAPALPGARRDPNQAGVRGLIPQQLPPPTPGFVCRDRQLTELDATIGGGQAALTVLTGMPGVGKSALAIHWAYRVRDRFPDGQLYVNLRGHHPDGPLPPCAALAQLLAGLGVPADAVPADEHQAAALFRSAVSDRRVLVVLDGAVSPEQVRLLRPGGAGACTVVTSRDSLAGLMVQDGARVLRVPALDDACAIRLLAHAAGEATVAAEPESAAALAELCDRLPLAIRIAAATLDEAAATPLADLVRQIRAGGRLAALGVHGDPRARLSSAFADSYAALDEPRRRLFRLFGAMDEPEVSASIAAARLRITTVHARALLRQLAEVNLISATAGDRYGMSGLLHEYAREVARAAGQRPVHPFRAWAGRGSDDVRRRRRPVAAARLTVNSGGPDPTAGPLSRRGGAGRGVGGEPERVVVQPLGGPLVAEGQEQPHERGR